MRGKRIAAITMFFVVIVHSMFTANFAHADSNADVRAHYERATRAHAEGRYEDAAESYERAYALRPDPTLLYNAAQSRRAAGDRARAIEHFEEYLEKFQGQSNRAEVEKKLAELRVQVAAPSPSPAPSASPSPSPLPSPAVAKAPLVKKAWFWGVIAGGVVLVAGAITLGLVFGQTVRDPVPTFGTVPGN